MTLSCTMAIMDKTVSNDFWSYNLGTICNSMNVCTYYELIIHICILILTKELFTASLRPLVLIIISCLDA